MRRRLCFGRQAYPFCRECGFVDENLMKHIISQRGKRESFDVIVVGSGIAGLCYVLELLRLHPTTRVALISKTVLTQSNTFYAQGGIAAATLPNDSIAAHIAD